MPVTSASFETDHFPADTDALKALKSIATDSQAAKDVDAYLKQHKAKQVEEYEYPLQILNRLNDLVHKKYCSSAKKLKFIDHHKYTITHHPNDFSGSPDFYCGEESIIQTYEECQLAAPWHYSESVFELNRKRTHEEGLKQAGTHAGMLNQARPDKPGVYVGYMSPEGYQIIWSDPSGLYISDQYPLMNLLPLTKYIYCLYLPPADHILRDTTITLTSPAVPMERPLWNVQFEGVTYENCAVQTVGRPWTRMTWVAIPQGQPETVIKDTYVREDGRLKEGDYYDLLQRDGPAPGWVHVRTWGEVKNGGEAILTPINSRCAKKIRLIMGTTGEPIHACKSVFEFLKAMYDVLESHRWAVLKRRVLHRDVSYSNILIRPQGTYMPGELNDDDRPKFVDEILSGTRNAPPTAILYDLDHATLLEGADASRVYVKQDVTCRRERTGTPMYVSRAVCKGAVLECQRFWPMPPVPSECSTSYFAIHSSDPFRRFHDTTETRHGGIPDMDWMDEVSENNHASVSLFRHEPRHDAESIFWVMVSFLLRALPLSDADDTNEDALDGIWEPFAEHSIPTVKAGVASKNDPRDSMFYNGYHWKGYLHPELACLAHMMAELSKQVKPEYTFILPKVNEVHLHEAMQRVILGQLWKMKGGGEIDLDLDYVRTVTEYIDPRPRRQNRRNRDGRGTTTGSKRDCPDSEVVDKKFKRLRSTHGSQLQSIPDEEAAAN